VWSHHVGDPILLGDRTRRVDHALFMVHALTGDSLVHVAPAIVCCRTPSALARGRWRARHDGALVVVTRRFACVLGSRPGCSSRSC